MVLVAGSLQGSEANQLLMFDFMLLEHVAGNRPVHTMKEVTAGGLLGKQSVALSLHVMAQHSFSTVGLPRQLGLRTRRGSPISAITVHRSGNPSSKQPYGPGKDRGALKRAAAGPLLFFLLVVVCRGWLASQPQPY